MKKTAVYISEFKDSFLKKYEESKNKFHERSTEKKVLLGRFIHYLVHDFNVQDIEDKKISSIQSYLLKQGYDLNEKGRIEIIELLTADFCIYAATQIIAEELSNMIETEYINRTHNILSEIAS